MAYNITNTYYNIAVSRVNSSYQLNISNGLTIELRYDYNTFF